MPAAGGHLQRALHVLLAPDFAEVGAVPELRGHRRPAVPHELRDRLVSGQVRRELEQVPHGEDAHAFDERRLPHVRLGHVDGLDAAFLRQPHHGQDALGVAHRAVQRQLAQEDGMLHVGHRLLGGDEEAHGDGQVVGRPLLPEVGRGQVHGDAPVGEGEAGVADRGAHPLLRLLHRRVRQADDGEGGHP